MDDKVLQDGHVAGEPRLPEDAVQPAEGDRHPSQQQRRQPEQAVVPCPRPEREAPESLQRKGAVLDDGGCFVRFVFYCCCSATSTSCLVVGSWGIERWPGKRNADIKYHVRLVELCFYAN